MVETRNRSLKMKNIKKLDETSNGDNDCDGHSKTKTSATTIRMKTRNKVNKSNISINNKENNNDDKNAKKSKNLTKKSSDNLKYKKLTSFSDVEKSSNGIDDKTTENTNATIENNNDFNFYNYEISYVTRMIENLLDKSEANSLIICGDAGVGKTKLIETCFDIFPVLSLSSSSLLNSDYIKKNSSFSNFNHLKVALFKFDGAIHGKDDLATIRLIGRYLNRFLDQQQENNDIDLMDDSSERDLSMLNDLELSERVNNSIPKIMSQLRNLTENYQNFRAIIVLDNFDVFCRKQQTLLYNLLDLTQHGRSILVIGITRRLDYLELLEKRVRSRLTQRVVHLISPFESYDLFRNFCSFRIKQLCVKNPLLESNFNANNQLIENELKRSFAINPNFIEINRIVNEYSFYMNEEKLNDEDIDNLDIDKENLNKKTKLFNDDDRKNDRQMQSLLRLKKNDLIFLIIIMRNLKNNDSKIFTSVDLFNWSIGCTLLRKIRMGLLLKSINNLIDSDFIIQETDCYCNNNNNRKKYQNKQHYLCITKWTKLLPNISDQHLEQFIKDNDHILPQTIKRLW